MAANAMIESSSFQIAKQLEKQQNKQTDSSLLPNVKI